MCSTSGWESNKKKQQRRKNRKHTIHHTYETSCKSQATRALDILNASQCYQFNSIVNRKKGCCLCIVLRICTRSTLFNRVEVYTENRHRLDWKRKKIVSICFMFAVQRANWIAHSKRCTISGNNIPIHSVGNVVATQIQHNTKWMKMLEDRKKRRTVIELIESYKANGCQLIRHFTQSTSQQKNERNDIAQQSVE